MRFTHVVHSGGLLGQKPLTEAAYWRWTTLVTLCEAKTAEGPPQDILDQVDVIFCIQVDFWVAC